MNIKFFKSNSPWLLTGLLVFTSFFAAACIVFSSQKVHATSQATVTAQLSYNEIATNSLISSQPTLSAGGDLPMPAVNGTSTDAVGSVFDIEYTPPCEDIDLNDLISVSASVNHSYSPQPFDSTDGFIMTIMDSVTSASLPNLTTETGDAGLFVPGILTIGYSGYGGTTSLPGTISGIWNGPSSNPLILYLSSDLDGTSGATSTTTDPVVQLTFDTTSCPVSELPAADTDPISDAIEDAAPGLGDANNDGTADSEQPNVTSLLNTISGSYSVLQTNCTTNTTTTLSPESSDNKDVAYDYNQGLMNFTATGCGSIAAITQYFYGNLNANNVTARKYNPTTNTYSTIPGAAITNVTIGNQKAIKITYQVADNGPLDLNPTLGTITDPSGPAVLTVGVPETGL